MTTKPELLEYDLGPAVRAFTTTRFGGCSEGNYASFNINGYCGDNPAHVAANRAALCGELGIQQDRLILPHQVHGKKVLAIDRPLLALDEVARHERIEGIDAVMTDVTGVCVGVSTADCIPVLLYDEEHCAVAAVHAGWRGTVKGIVAETVRAMSLHYGTEAAMLRAVIAPGISVAAFEVGDEVYDAFAAAGFPMNVVARRMGRWHIDLNVANFLQLEAAGVPLGRIQVSSYCTYTECDRFFSARRLGIQSGRLYTGILLRPDKQ